MCQFQQADEIINKHLTYLRIMAQLIGDPAFDEKEFKKSILKTEEVAIETKRRFIDAVSKAFLFKYYFIRGIATEIRGGNLVDQARLKDALESLFTHTQVFPKIIQQELST